MCRGVRHILDDENDVVVDADDVFDEQIMIILILITKIIIIELIVVVFINH